MSCKSDLSTLVGEIEWLVKDHSGGKLLRKEGQKSCPKSTNDEFFTMKITLDVFVKLHQMLQNYIGLIDFRGAKSRGFEEVKIPLKEALDVAVRAMISAMQSPVPKQPSSNSVCPNCIGKSGCTERRSGNGDAEFKLGKLAGVEEVDEKLRRLKKVAFENVEKLKTCIKELFYGITKLPCTLMESRLEILSSVVKNTKDKMTSCGRQESLMGTQVNPISQIISEFILEYGEIKSKVFPCRKICRFCGSVVCHVDRERGIFCCENARSLNFLWKEWMLKNSVNGVAKWDEETIISIVESFRSGISQVERRSRCLGIGPCAAAHGIPGPPILGLSARHGEDSSTQAALIKKNLPPDRGHLRSSLAARTEFKGDMEERNSESRKRGKIMTSDFPRAGNSGDEIRGDPGGQGSRHGKNHVRVERSNTGERLSRNEAEGVERFGVKLKRRGSIGRGIRSAEGKSEKNVTRERGTNEALYRDKKGSKKPLDKDTDAARNVGADGDAISKKGVTIRNRKGVDDGMTGKDAEGQQREGKSHQRKTEGEHTNRSGDQNIGNTSAGGKESDVKSKKKKKKENLGIKNDRNSGKNENEKSQDDELYHEKLRAEQSIPKNREKGVSGSGRRQSGNSDVGKNLGAENPGENYGVADGEQNAGGEREAKSDPENIIRYRLSDKLFIELGWTLLPKDTVMRRVVEFQSLEAKPHMNWLRNNRTHGRQYYPDGKTIFLDFIEDGTGHVYYPNGETAVEAKISQKQTHELYKIYAQGGRDALGVMRDPWLMGVFDSMGNGVVYDDNCDVRITYNQNGGVFLDNPSKVPFSWGWNNFQTSPIEQPVYEDHPNDQLPKNLLPIADAKNRSNRASNKSVSSNVTSSGKTSEIQPVSEVQKSVEESLETTKPWPQRKRVSSIKPICLKINKYLSLRILDRRNINLKFFAGQKSIRIELGTEVNPSVQVNSELVDSDNWVTKMTRSRYDLNAIKTSEMSSPNAEDSLLEIAEEIQRAKNEAKARKLMIAKYKPHLISSSNCNS